MPTIVTHALLPLIAAAALPRNRVAAPLIAAGMIAAVIPDLDVIGFRLGIDYGDTLGHRGASHSLAFSFLLGVLAAAVAPALRSSRPAAFLFVSVSAASHALTDMLTNGGLGVALFWPVEADRLFFPLRPVEVSPIGLSRFFGGEAMHVLASEVLWLVVPVALVAIFARIVARNTTRRTTAIDLQASRK